MRSSFESDCSLKKILIALFETAKCFVVSDKAVRIIKFKQLCKSGAKWRENMKNMKKIVSEYLKAVERRKRVSEQEEQARKALFKCFIKKVNKTSSKDELRQLVEQVPPSFFRDPANPRKLLIVAEIHSELFSFHPEELEDRDVYRLIYVLYRGGFDREEERVRGITTNTIKLFANIEIILKPRRRCFFAPPTKHRKTPGELCLVCSSGPLDGFIKRIK